MIKSVIFDMDGTLLDSSYAMTCTVNYVRSTIGLEPISKEFLQYHINQPDQDLPMTFYGVKKYTLTHQKLFREHYLENSSLHVRPYEGVLDLLEYLKSKNLTLSIATNASDFFAKHMLENCKMIDYFTHIIGANNVQNRKPSPDMLQHLAKLTSIPQNQTILIGDSIKDEFAAENANMEFIFANWGYGKSESAINQIISISELLEYFKKAL